VTALYEDREGNVWVGSPQGIERLRDSAFVTQPIDAAIHAGDSSGPVYVDNQGRAWIAPSSGGLYSLFNGTVARVSVPRLDRDVIYSIDGANNELWLGGQHTGLTHLRLQDGAVTSTKTYTKAEGLPQNSVYAVHRSPDGSVWAATLNGGVGLLRNGHITTFAAGSGLPSNSIVAIEDTAEATWFATPSGLTTLSHGPSSAKESWRTFTSTDGLPSDDVISLLSESDGSLWIGTANGLSVLRAGRIQSLSRLHPILREPILGLAQDKLGSLWISTATHLASVDHKRLLENSTDLRLREYSPVDGLPGTETIRRNRSVISDTRGRIWFSLNQGLATVDPARAFAASAPSLTQIESLSADGTTVHLDTAASLPAATHRLTINYTGLSLGVPELVRYRYRLDGFDRDWNESTTLRQAVYTNLAPGSYRFHVLSSNSEDQWNGQEATYDFTIAPAFWQTWWFQLSFAIALVLLATLIFHWRMRQMTERLNLRFEERLAERTRIAQELHDTLLQGFLSASMQLHVAAEQLTPGSSIRPSLDRILTLMQQVNEEGRNTLRGLRSDSADSLTLEQALSRVPNDFASSLTSVAHPAFRVIVQGQPRMLHPVIRDEVLRIGREAIVNAFLHARATNVEVEIEYTSSHLHFLIRDDGIGIDPTILRSGREGHWGIIGMRERAQRIEASLKLFSRADAGTEVELTVPGSTAYQNPSRSLRSRIARLWIRARRRVA
jgi:signal transduction histidine kinase/streptogramin lyase